MLEGHSKASLMKSVHVHVKCAFQWWGPQLACACVRCASAENKYLNYGPLISLVFITVCMCVQMV